MLRFYGSATELGDREVGVVCSTPNLGRDGMVVEPSGIDLAAFRKNPIVLWQHDPTAPVGTATALGISNGDLCARIAFAPLRASPLADQICSLTKCGVINAVSIGFNPTETVPLNPKDPRAGRRVVRSELMECSFVSIPADTGALVVQRSAAAFRRLPSIPIGTVWRTAARTSGAAKPAVFSPTMHAWMLLDQRRHEDEAVFGAAARREALRQLSQTTKHG